MPKSSRVKMIFRETLRRTVIFLHLFVTICNLFFGQLDTRASHLFEGNKVTLSAHLWNAKSAFNFVMAWNVRKHFLVHDLDLTEVLEETEPDDFDDDFAKTMLVGLQGIDDVKGWFYTRGSVFREYVRAQRSQGDSTGPIFCDQDTVCELLGHLKLPPCASCFSEAVLPTAAPWQSHMARILYLFFLWIINTRRASSPQENFLVLLFFCVEFRPVLKPNLRLGSRCCQLC